MAAPTRQQEFVTALMPYARAMEQQTGIPAAWTIAMAANETGWDLSNPVLFGIKGTSPSGQSGTFGTWEYTPGNRIQDQFATYSDPREAFSHLTYEMGTPRYQGAPRTSAGAFAGYLQSQGWATDPAYASKIARLSGDVQGILGSQPATAGGGQVVTEWSYPGDWDEYESAGSTSTPGSGGPSDVYEGAGGPMPAEYGLYIKAQIAATNQAITDLQRTISADPESNAAYDAKTQLQALQRLQASQESQYRQWQQGEASRKETARKAEASEVWARQKAAASETWQREKYGEQQDWEREKFYSDRGDDSIRNKIAQQAQDIAAGRLDFDKASEIFQQDLANAELQARMRQTASSAYNQANQLVLAGSPFAAPPGATHFPGFEPGGSMALASRRMGSRFTPVGINRIAFNPRGDVERALTGGYDLARIPGTIGLAQPKGSGSNQPPAIPQPTVVPPAVAEQWATAPPALSQPTVVPPAVAEQWNAPPIPQPTAEELMRRGMGQVAGPPILPGLMRRGMTQVAQPPVLPRPYPRFRLPMPV